MVPGDLFSGALTRAPGESVGTYPILVGTLTLGANYDMSFVSAPFTIRGATSGQITSSAAQTCYGETVTFIARFTSPSVGSLPMTGTVDFYEGSTYLGRSDLHPEIPPGASRPLVALGAEIGIGTVSGTAQLPISSLTIGAHTIQAVYSGDANYDGATTETPVSVTVVQATTSTTLSSVPSAAGTLLTAHVVVTSPGSPPLSGQVTFYDGSTVVGSAPLIDGIASLNVTGLAPGIHSFTAVYAGTQTSSSSADRTTVSTDGPKVIGVSRFGIHASPTIISLTFDGSLDPGRAQATTNYRITDRRGRIIRVTRAVYNRQTNQVELHLAQRLCLNQYYTLTAFGVPPVGLTGSTGIPLDGTGKNQPGTNFVTRIGWYSLGVPGRTPAVSYVDGTPHSYTGRMHNYLAAILRVLLHKRP